MSFAGRSRRIDRLEERVEPALPPEERTFRIVTAFLDTADDDQKKEVLAAIDAVRAAREPRGPPTVEAVADASAETAPAEAAPPSPARPASPEPPPAPVAAETPPPCQGEEAPPPWREVWWRPRGQPDPYDWNSEPDAPPGTNGTCIADYDIFAKSY